MVWVSLGSPIWNSELSRLECLFSSSDGKVFSITSSNMFPPFSLSLFSSGTTITWMLFYLMFSSRSFKTFSFFIIIFSFAALFVCFSVLSFNSLIPFLLHTICFENPSRVFFNLLYCSALWLLFGVILHFLSWSYSQFVHLFFLVWWIFLWPLLWIFYQLDYLFLNIKVFFLRFLSWAFI